MTALTHESASEDTDWNHSSQATGMSAGAGAGAGAVGVSRHVTGRAGRIATAVV